MQNCRRNSTADATNIGGARRNGDAASVPFQPHYTPSQSQKQGPSHGQVRGDVWAKTARASIHMLKVPKGWALDVADLDAAQAVGVRVIHIHDQEQLAHYWATLATVRRRGFPFERRFGPQIALPLEHWRATRQEAEALAEPEQEPKDDDGPTQLGLWAA